MTFVTFEGLEGCGKSTQVSLLYYALNDRGQTNTERYREPGGTAISNQIRAVLHDLRNEEMHETTEMLLYAAARSQLVHQIIKPELEAGKIVLCDRFFDSTVAYQGYGRGLPMDTIQALVQIATVGLKPDLTFYLKVSPEVGATRRRRAADEGEEFNRMDAQALDFYQRVAHGYDEIVNTDPDRWVIIDGNPDQQTVHLQVLSAYDARFPQGVR